MNTQPAAGRPRRRRWWIPVAIAGFVIISAVSVYLWQIFVLGNFHEVVRGEVYRSGQPSAAQLTSWVGEHHIRTVVNLRNQVSPDILLEEATLRRMGIAYVSAELPVKHPPSGAELRRLIEVTEKAERPILFHCWRGADRTGLASCIAAMMVGGETFEKAQKQISFLYGHFNLRGYDVTGPTELYEKWCRGQKRNTGGWSDFRAWVYGVYDNGKPEQPIGNVNRSEIQRTPRGVSRPVSASTPVLSR